jgi:transglutaminase-like putative cysteine protease
MKLDVRHRTIYLYEQQVSVSQHVLHLQPRHAQQQRRLAFRLDVSPEPAVSSMSTDYFGNTVHYLTIQEPHERLVIEAKSSVDVTPRAGTIDLLAGEPWEVVAARLHAAAPDTLDAQQYCFDSQYSVGGAAVFDYARPSFTAGRPILEALADLTSRIFRDFKYQGGVSDVSTPVSDVLRMRRGVCQDFAHLQLACVRSHGLAARYVSGYLMTQPPPGQPKLIGADASHAWISAWAGDLGWVDFDPTNDLIPDAEHVTVGWGRDYGDVSPINGFITGGGNHQISVSVDVSQT